jgi:AcrR family transcriptional regulator
MERTTSANPHVENDLQDLWPESNEVYHPRREQILDAADQIIATEGIHRLSLGNIEDKTGMSRGQLTYYFPKKEAILIAVFDRMLRRMIAEIVSSGGPTPGTGQAWDCTKHMFAHRLTSFAQGSRQDLSSLIYTFLAQMNHREDYRDKLAFMFEEWRTRLADDWTLTVPEPRPPLSPRIAATLIQALVNGLTMQLAVNPNTFDSEEMLAACEWLLAPMFGKTTTNDQAPNPRE